MTTPDTSREAMVRLLQTITRNGSLDDGRTLHEVIADALLARGLRLPGDERAERVIVDLAAHLAAAISLLERVGKTAKKAAPSDKMFDQMLADYRASLERARALLNDGGRDE
ncbi:MAG: hypothetical protein M0R28_20405 [Pigmentiphaga sp.]|nr:hypothetical protein [Pigmentiphaga sp.]